MGHHGAVWSQMDWLWWNINRRWTQDLVLWRGEETSAWGGIHCQERDYRQCHQLHAYLKQTHLHLCISQTTQHDHNPGLCSNYRPWWWGGLKVFWAFRIHHNRSPPEGHSHCTRGLECYSRPRCIWELGRNSQEVWHWWDSWQGPQTAWVCQKPLPCLSQHSPPPQAVSNCNLALK